MNRRHFSRLLLAAAGGVAFPRRARSITRPQVRVNGSRLNRLFEQLRRVGRTPAGGVERLAYSEEDRQARETVMGWMREAGLDVRIDEAANIIARRAGSDPDLPPLLAGSHIDSVPDGGAYDGNVGALGALEAAWTLADEGIVTRHPLEIVIFQNEEGGLYGSEAMAGRLTEADLDQVSQSGRTVREGIAFLGGTPDRIRNAARRSGEIGAYLELHIEQGGMLEVEGMDIGVVEGIVGIEWWDVTVEGFANHAGTTPMDGRRDALLAAARFVEAVNDIVTGIPGRQVGTVGQIAAYPGAPNVIPGRVTASLELRDLDAERIQTLFRRIRAEANAIGERTGTTFTFVSRGLDIAPALTDQRVQGAIVGAARELSLSFRLMPSGAGHDAQSLAALAPIGMIFIPSAGGVSHSPREHSDPEDLVNGANVLVNGLLGLDGMVG
jgi:N-carbamoyl-L-amino-acid hydrolase